MDTATVTAWTSILTVVIWAVYLQLFLVRHRRENRPFMIIHHAQDNIPEALCLFVNMSREPIHVVFVTARIFGAFGELQRKITDYERMTADDRNVQTRLRQGPVQSGGYLVLGTFEELILGRDDPEADPEKRPAALDEVDCLELCIVAVHGPSKRHIGARRRFLVEHWNGQSSICPHSVHTEQLVRPGKRRIVRRWTEEQLKPRFRGGQQTVHTSQGGQE